jgi:hypothetical protein
MKNSYFKIIGLKFALLTIILSTNAQAYPTTVGQPSIQNMKTTTESASYLTDGTRAFTQLSTSPTFQFGKSFMENCSITNIGAPFTLTTLLGGLVYMNGVVYTWNQSTPYQLWSIDTVTGIYTLVFNMSGVPLTNLTGMCWNGTTMYGVSTNISISRIFTVNMSTGVCTSLGSNSTISAALLMGRIGTQYGLYSVDIDSDCLYKWNKTTGTAALIGPLGVNATTILQDGCVDPNDNTFYWMAYTTGSELRKIDTLTGSAGPVLCTYSAQGSGIALVPFGLNGIHQISGEIPNEFSLSQNYPNPFNPVTKIKFSIPSIGNGRDRSAIKIYNALGREVQTLVNQSLQPGTYEVDWDASNHPSGVYFYELTSGNFAETKKMVLLK